MDDSMKMQCSMKHTLLYLILLAMPLIPLYGQEDLTPVNTGAANYLTIPTDARSAAMGGTGVALSGGDNAIFHNGAVSLADDGRRGGATYTYSPWMRDYDSGFSLHSVGGFYKINKRNAVLLGFRYFGYPKIEGVGEELSTLRPKEMAIEAGYAYEVIRNLSVSATFKYLYSDMGKVGNSSGASSVAFDLGILYRQKINNWEGAGWSVGAQASNLGPKIKYLTSKEALPAMVKVGGATDLPFSQIHRLILTADLGYRLSPADVQAFNASAGAEYVLMEHFMLRGGYHYGDKDKGDTNYATAGAGVKYAGVHLDFAWLFAGHDCLARNTFWLSLGYSF